MKLTKQLLNFSELVPDEKMALFSFTVSQLFYTYSSTIQPR